MISHQPRGSYLSKLMYLMAYPTPEMVKAGEAVIPECIEAAYIGSTAAKDIFTAMSVVALEQAEHG